ncbi:MAG: sulfatase-like hydrolase/transferase [Elusimicrobiaceae bacterium]|nr:sulfatase-like hydrolase/transferase [Elusimicrobiaceae bacterium]
MWIKKPKRTDFRLKLSIIFILLAMILFSAFRLILYVLYHSTFSSLTTSAIWSAFLNGMRFDLSMVALFMGPVILLLNLPVNSVRYVKYCVLFLITELIVMSGFLIADLIYFPYVKRHIAEEILQVSADWGFVIHFALTKALLPLLILFVLFILAGIWVHKVFKYRYIFDPYYAKGELLKLGACILFILLGIRGHLGTGKPIGIADVYQYAPSPAAAALTLNGVFTAYQVGRKGSVDIQNDFPVEKAFSIAQQQFIGANEKVEDPTYPLMRRPVKPSKAQDINIFIVLLEGWHPYYVDSLSGNHFGVTPVFDEIVKNGVNFTNAYAVGLRSIFGFAGVLASVPLVPGLPMFGYGLELSSFFRFPGVLAEKGWYPFFAQTSHRDSYRLCSLASYLGVQGSYGWEDMKELLPYIDRAPFGYDYDGLMFGADQVKTHLPKQVMGMVFTGITHSPFARTLPQFDKYKGKTWDDQFKNTLYFADWSIGELLKRAQEEGWFDNTIFVFVSDHTSGGPDSDSLYNKFRIPLVFYAPKIFEPRTIDYVVSQLDIVPTLYDLVGLDVPYTAFGRNMFDNTHADQRVALVSEGVNIGLITKQGALRHSRKQILSVEKLAPDFDEKQAEETLLALDKTAYTLLKNNTWYKDEQ